jgi:hypothetical protein
VKVFSKIDFSQINEALGIAVDAAPELIPSLITGRLYNEGTDYKGKELRTDTAKQQNNPYYSRFTLSIKQRQGQRTTNVTLNDTGEFYNSFVSKVNNKEIIINAETKDIFDNFEKHYSSEKDFEKAILNLSEDDRKIFIREILPNFIKQFKILAGKNI